MQNTYQAPKLTDLGSVESITAGMSTGTQLDSDFPSNTPIGKLTFS